MFHPATFPANPSGTDADESDSPFVASTDVYYDEIRIAAGQTVSFSGGGPFHVNLLEVGDGSTLRLGAGIYFIDELRLGKDVVVEITSEEIREARNGMARAEAGRRAARAASSAAIAETYFSMDASRASFHACPLPADSGGVTKRASPPVSRARRVQACTLPGNCSWVSTTFCPAAMGRFLAATATPYDTPGRIAIRFGSSPPISPENSPRSSLLAR